MDVLSNEPKLCKVLGDVNGIECPRTYYCCKWGCCVTPAFQFYQLWYYWVLVILMFMLCSGGGWWYRYWLAGRFPGIPTSQVQRLRHAELGNLPRSSDSTLSSQVALNQNIHRQCVRVSYDPARRAVMMQRLWKVPVRVPQRPQPPPSYFDSESDAHRRIDMTASEAPAVYPYYQLYGPPPSYDSVVALNSESAGHVAIQSNMQQEVSDSCTAQSHAEQQERQCSSSSDIETLHQENVRAPSSLQSNVPEGEGQPTACGPVGPVSQSQSHTQSV